MSDDNDSYIKLADFGFAARVHEPNSLSKQCGTPFFVSPEILMRKGYDQQSDMWSVGCIVFLLLSGNLPFMGRSQKELFRKIVAGKYDFEDDEWKDVSEQAKDLVTKMLVLDPSKRITAAEAVRHEWLKASRDRLSMIMLQSTSQKLKTFNARMKLRSAMIAVDWVSSLKRMSSFSTRNLNTSDASGGSGSSGTEKSPLMAAARRMKAYEEAQKDKSDSEPAQALPAPAPVARTHATSDRPRRSGGSRSGSSSSEGRDGRKNLSSATKGIKKMSLREESRKKKEREASTPMEI